MQLNTLANSILNDSRLAILPQKCQVNFLKLVCSNIYRKCPHGGDISSGNIFIYTDIYSYLFTLNNLYPSVVPSPFIPVPFQRPCLEVCERVSSTCLGLMELIGIRQNCSAQIDYSGGTLNALYAAYPYLPLPYQYDPSNNESRCNAMNSSFVVAGTKEPYLKANDPSGFCYGITTELYVPPGSSVSPALGPMQPPYVVQSIIEDMLTKSFSALPVWLSQKCHSALKKYVCTSSLLAPSAQSLTAVLRNNGLDDVMQARLVHDGIIRAELLSYSFFLPSYPHRSICLEYAASCGEFINASGLSMLQYHCAEVKRGVQSYPTTNQTIFSLPLALPAIHLDISFTTPPNYAYSTSTATTLKYETKCPTGYVVPTTEDSRIKWVSGTGCAIGCVSAIWSRDQWSTLYFLNQLVAWISFPIVAFFLLTWCVDKDKRKQYLVICFASFSFIVSLFNVITSMEKTDTRFCASNAVPIDQGDGCNICNSQAIVLVFCGLGCSASWSMLALDMFLKVCAGYRHTGKFRIYFLFFIFIIPLVFTSYAITLEYGFTNVMPFCFLVENGKDITAFYGPTAVLTGIGVVLSLGVAAKCIRSAIILSLRSAHETDSSSSKDVLSRLYVLKKPMIFLGFFTALTVTFTLFRFLGYKLRRELASNLIDFTTCVFKYYDGTDASWQAHCGTSPPYNYSFHAWTFCCVVGQSILISSIYLLSPSAWKYWRQLIGMSALRRQLHAVSSMNSVGGGRKHRFNENGSLLFAPPSPRRKVKVAAVHVVSVDPMKVSSDRTTVPGTDAGAAENSSFVSGTKLSSDTWVSSGKKANVYYVEAIRESKNEE